MAITTIFRTQHDDLVKIVQQISAQLKPELVTANAAGIAKLFTQLAGKITVHLAMEDESLYPKMIKHANPNIANTAKKFMTEMGTIKTAFTGFMKKWGSETAMKGNPTAFITETQGLFGVLAKRIEKENNELYKMMDEAQ